MNWMNGTQCIIVILFSLTFCKYTLFILHIVLNTHYSVVRITQPNKWYQKLWLLVRLITVWRFQNLKIMTACSIFLLRLLVEPWWIFSLKAVPKLCSANSDNLCNGRTGQATSPPKLSAVWVWIRIRDLGLDFSGYGRCLFWTMFFNEA